MRFFLFIIFLLGLSSIAISQADQYEKEFLLKLEKSKSDSESVVIYNLLAYKLHNSDMKKSLAYCLKGLELCKKNKYPVKEASFYQIIADTYWFSGDVSTSMEYYLKELRIGDSLNNKTIIANSKYNIGWIKSIQQNQTSQVHYLYEALDIYVEKGDTGRILQVFDALANYYKNNAATFKHNRDSCEKYYLGVLNIIERSRFKLNVGACYANVAAYYMSVNNNEKSLFYSKKGIDYSDKEHDEYSLIANKIVLAEAYYNMDSLPRSKKIIESLFPFFSNPVHESVRLSSYRILTDIYKREKNFEKAFGYSVSFKLLSDSMNKQIFDQSLLQKETDYMVDKKNKEVQALELANQVAGIKNKQNFYVIISLGVFALLILVFLYNLSRSNRSKQQANRQLSEQNKIIAHKKEEIEQSIQYAKGIQNAILPSIVELKKHLPESFILYIPKDVVSGDFYWFNDVTENVGDEKIHEKGGIKNGLLLAAADCTGHGVPGSLMSIVSIDKLNHSFLGKKLIAPSQILKAINNDIKNALKQDGQSNIQKDGLDIALLLFEKDTNKLTYSGANRPLWIIREKELIEYKPTKSSIAGHTEIDHEYEEQVIQLKKDDFVVIFSDGYADQFGGKNGKKMMTKSFKQSLLSLSSLTISEIEQGLLRNFNDWKSDYEQVDDVLVIGFKI